MNSALIKGGDKQVGDPRARDLARMQRVPLLLLLLMAALYAFTLGRVEAWAGWVHAFAEAGMVGALADWFAVVALFRHPLGIPIPHTAIIPRRKDELGAALARFVAEHFLEPSAVRSKLQGLSLARHLLDWLASDAGRARLATIGGDALVWVLGALDEKSVRSFLARLSRRQLEQLDFSGLSGRFLGWLMRGQRHQELFTQVLRHLIVLLDSHREAIREGVRQGSPWWVPGFVDDKILRQMLEHIETRLFEMSLDAGHPLRLQFDAWLAGFAADLQTSTEYKRAGERFRQQLLDNQELQDYLYGLWSDLAERIRGDLAEPESRIRSELAERGGTLAGELAADPEILALLDDWLTRLVVTLVERNRMQIASLISDTVRSWDGELTARRIELAIGRDLQFIRINGTLVGGLVGLVLYALTKS